MRDSQHYIKAKFLLFGLLTGISIFLLLGARSQDDVVLLASDRYQVSAWGDIHSHGAFVVDSLTGKTKLVYRHDYGMSEEGGISDDAIGEDLEGSEVGEAPSGPQDYLGLPFTKIP